MSRSFTPRQFIRVAPKSLIQQHFAKYGIGTRLNWEEIPAGQPDLMMAELFSAPEKTNRDIIADWQTIFEQADEGGIRTIIEAGKSHHPKVELESLFQETSGSIERSFYTFLNHRHIFDHAKKLDFADGVQFVKRAGVPVDEFSSDDAALSRLTTNLSDYFAGSGDRGHGCLIDAFQRDDRYYYFCYLEDYPETDQSFSSDHKLMTSSRKPAYEVVLILNLKERTLETRAKGGRKRRVDIETIFGRSVLKVDLGEPDPVTQIYNLDLLTDEDFELSIAPGRNVRNVTVTSLKARILGRDEIITIDVPANAQRHACYNMVKNLLIDTFGRDLIQIVQARFRVVFCEDSDNHRKSLTFTVSHPASCSLRADPSHDVCKHLLKQWEIDETGSPDYSAPEPRPNAQYRFWN